MIYTEEAPGLHRISLVQKIEGFRDFVSSWLYTTENLAYIVDPGPLHTIPVLIDTLDELGIDKLDYILLTHIHIDHAGGAGKLLEVYPEARVICHPKGIPHMIDPSKLWQGSLKVLGEIAEAYGEIVPIPEDKIQFVTEIPVSNGTIQVIDTPGHAPHHLCYDHEKTLFAGEVAGVCYSFDGMVYRRPATPPRFKLEISLSSLDRVLALDLEAICFGHFGRREDPQNALRTARTQLILWTDVTREQLAKGENDLYQRIKQELILKDPAFGVYKKLDDDIRSREDDFFKNTINGIKEYVMSQTQSSG